MSNGSLHLGRVLGIPVRAHWSIALIAALFGVNLASSLGVTAGIVAVLAFFVSILAHEFGHALVARRYGVETESIDLWALGGVARLDREPPTPRADGLIAGAGPIVSLVIGVVTFGSAYLLTSNVLAWIGIVNLFLAVFNMLPGAPLDGGRVLRAVRWARTGSKYRAMRDAGNAGRVLGWSLGIIGVALMVNGTSGIFIAITGLFIALNAKAEISASYVSEHLDGVKVRDLTWWGVAHAGSDMDADSMIEQRSRLGEAGAVAIDANDDGQLDGLVLEDQLWAIPGDQRALVMLNSLMVPFHQTARASLDDDLSAVLPRLNPVRPVVTVWNEGKLVGVVPPKVLTQRLDGARAAALGQA
ncbi:site-2 protease family protein [Ilumatobacter nonamiensis]|uniref:site-2 protease family protein n=1 Tax=Ilumatobacter nonamiensis TaxID=467093 RepID=UPI00058B8E15|nr:site-2 protease family protein [Ilumatobacter nonamiensis]